MLGWLCLVPGQDVINRPGTGKTAYGMSKREAFEGDSVDAVDVWSLREVEVGDCYLQDSKQSHSEKLVSGQEWEAMLRSHS